MTIEDPGGLMQGGQGRGRPRQRAFVRFERVYTKGGRYTALFQLSSLQPSAQFQYEEVDCGAKAKNDDQATREGFRLLRQELKQRMRLLSEEEDLFRRRLADMLVSLEIEKKRVLGE